VFGLLIGAGIVLLRSSSTSDSGTHPERRPTSATGDRGDPRRVVIARLARRPADYGDVIRNPGQQRGGVPNAADVRHVRGTGAVEPPADAFNFGFGNLGGGATPRPCPPPGRTAESVPARSCSSYRPVWSRHAPCGRQPGRRLRRGGQKVVVISTGEIDASPAATLERSVASARSRPRTSAPIWSRRGWRTSPGCLSTRSSPTADSS